MNEKVFAARLLSWREQHNMTQDELARMFGTTKQTLSRWENGRITPKLERLPFMAEIMGVSEEWLAGYNDAQERMSPADAGTTKVVLMIPGGHLLDRADLEALRWAGEIMARKKIEGATNE